MESWSVYTAREGHLHNMFNMKVAWCMVLIFCLCRAERIVLYISIQVLCWQSLFCARYVQICMCTFHNLTDILLWETGKHWRVALSILCMAISRLVLAHWPELVDYFWLQFSRLHCRGCSAYAEQIPRIVSTTHEGMSWIHVLYNYHC